MLHGELVFLSSDLLQADRVLLYLLFEHLDVVFEALESDEDDGEVVEGAVPRTCMKDLIGNFSRYRVDRRCLVLTVS